MIRRYEMRATLCIVLSLLMLVDFAVFNPAPAFALDKKSVLVGAGVGAVAGAGIALAAPAIAGAIGAAGGIGGVATAAVGGVAAVSGGILGALSGVVGAIGAGLGAIGGFLVGIVTSPLFIPALLIIGAAVAGYFLYKKYKAKKAGSAASGASDEVMPASDEIYVTPGDYEMSSVVPSGDEAEPVSIGDSAVISLGGDEVTVSDEVPAAVAAEAPTTTTTTEATVTGVPTTSDSLKAAHDRYLSAYQKYTNLVTNSGGADPEEVKRSLSEYREAYNAYQTMRATGSK